VRAVELSGVRGRVLDAEVVDSMVALLKRRQQTLRVRAQCVALLLLLSEARPRPLAADERPVEDRSRGARLRAVLERLG